MKRAGIATRLAALILASTAVILSLVVGYSFMVSREGMLDLARQNGALVAEATVHRIDAQLRATAKVTDTVAATLQDAPMDEDFLRDLARRTLFTNPGIYGTGIAFEPQAFERGRHFFAPYAYRKDFAITSTTLGSADYNYFAMDWYQLAREMRRPVWTEPYYDEGGGNALMVAYSAPFSRRTAHGLQRAGVVTANIDLVWMQRMISEVRVARTGYVFVLSRYGTYVAHPNPDMIMNETIFTRAENLGIASLRDLGREMVAGMGGFMEFSDLPGIGAAYVSYMPLPDQGWSVGVVLPRDEVLAGANRATRIMTGIGVGGFFLLAVVILLVSGTITRPLRLLTRAAAGVARGDLDHRLPAIPTGDEVGDLAASFGRMQASLKEHIATLTATTAAKERIQSELRIAHDIQMSILPKTFPPFPERTELDVHATILPAREVGGDLYDFFFVTPHQFCFLAGDVSGKGVPAAFFMAVTKTLIKVVAERELTPGDILAKVNDDLAADNESCMFVTLFLAVLDTRTGELRYANAGHNPPLVLRRHGGPEWTQGMEEPMAGAMPGMEYSTGTLTLHPGDAVFVFTDGVTEAMDATGALYSEERLFDTLATCHGAAAAEMTRTVSDAVSAWAEGAEQSDDITMLAVRYLGPDGTKQEG